jgi:hypothetical protein
MNSKAKRQGEENTLCVVNKNFSVKQGTLYGVNKHLLLQEDTLYKVKKDLSDSRSYVVWGQRGLV